MSDPSGAPLAMFLLFGAVFGTIALVGFVMSARRRKALEALAQQRGWQFSTTDPGDRVNSYLGYHPFGVGHGRRVLNVMQGTVELQAFEAFQYRYTTGAGKNQHTYVVSVAAAPMPIRAPGLSLQHENLGLKIFDALGGEDIDFEDDAFSRRYWVKCDDRKFAYDVIDPRMMEFLMDRADGWAWQWIGDRLVIHCNGSLSPERILQAVELLCGFVQHIPRHLLADERPRMRALA